MGRLFEILLGLALALLFFNSHAAHAASLGSRPTKPSGPRATTVLRVLSALDPTLEPGAGEAARRLLENYSELLEFLPLERLEHVLWGPESLELRFDFRGSSSLEVALPAVAEVALVPNDAADPLAGGKLVHSRGKQRRLVVHARVRFSVREGQIDSVRAGDLEIGWGLMRFDVKLVTEHRPGSWARDARGRILLLTDESGVPLSVAGRFRPIEADRWLVLEVRGTRREIPLAFEAEELELASARRVSPRALDRACRPLFECRLESSKAIFAGTRMQVASLH
jgi:hypothetical protein